MLPILAGCLAGLWALQSKGSSEAFDLLVLLLVCAVPATFFGLLEDLTKAVRARWRLLGPTLGTAIGILWAGAVIPAVGVPGLDVLLAYWPIAVLATVLMVVGFTQAMNIVDGLNGLSSGLAFLMLMATAWAGYVANDSAVSQVAVLLAAAVAGFWVLNFPRGALFLGDGGAYFLGFVLAMLWVLLLVRNPGEVSVWFVMSVAAHPTMETVFSILRRKVFRARPKPATAPDRLHLHTLVLRRRARVLVSASQRKAQPWASNALASVSVVFIAIGPIALACLNPVNHLWNFAVLLSSIALYLLQFWRITRFKGSLLLALRKSVKHAWSGEHRPVFQATRSPALQHPTQLP